MRRRPLLLLALLGLPAVDAFASRTALADASSLDVPRPPRLAAPSKPLAATDDVDAVAINPSGLAFLPAWQFSYLHQWLPADQPAYQPARGDAVGFAMPLLFGVSTGIRLENIRPPSASILPSMTSLTFAIAYRVSETLSFAADVRHWYANDLPNLDGATGFGVSGTWRPSPYVGFAFAARDLNAPAQSGSTVGITRQLDLGVALRPLGTRALEFGLESSIWDREDGVSAWSPRATLGFDIPSFGRGTAAFRVGDPRSDHLSESWSLTAGIEVAWDNLRAGGGVVAVGHGANPGWYAGASIGGFTQKPSLPSADRAVTIRLEDTPGPRTHVRLLRKLARLGRDPNVRAIAFIVKSEIAGSTAHAEEIADAIAALRRRGVKVLCHLEDGGGKSLLACAAADKISIHPAGGVRFAGLRLQSMFYGEALQKLGVDPDFVRIKEHKSASEAFVRAGPTDIAIADERELLNGLEQIYLTRISAGRRLTVEQTKAAIAKGPFVADEAIAAGFVDDKAFDDEVKARVQAMVGAAIPVGEEPAETIAPPAFGPQAKIAVVYIDGDIVDGRSQTIPILGTKTVGSYTIAEAIKAARDNPDVKGVVLRIESPGGSSMASDVMWREAEFLAHAKPTVVSMGSIAASGGYYAAAFGAPIYADAATITGSIGIFYGKADLSRLLGKLGVHVVTERTAPRADAESLYRGFTDEERVELLRKVEQFYAVFLDRISRGRHMSVEEIDAVGRGKVWLGGVAKEKKLVDIVGGFDTAFGDLREKLGLPEDVGIVEYPQPKESLLDLALSLLGVKAMADDPVEAKAELAMIGRAIAPFGAVLTPFLLYRSDEPLALAEIVDVP